jgi:integrase
MGDTLGLLGAPTMAEFIGSELVRKLKPESRDIRDTKITGFLIRCRPSGRHSYLVVLGRCKTMTLGRVGVMKPEDARAEAAALLGAVQRKSTAVLAEDPTLTRSEAKRRVQRELRASSAARVTWGLYLDEHYGPWVLQHRKRGDSLLAQLRRCFGDWHALPLADLNAFAIERWRTARAKGRVTPNTINKDLSALRGALSRAVEWSFIAAHPMRSVKAAKIDPNTRVRYLLPDESARLDAALIARDDERRDARARGNAWRRERGYDVRPEFGCYTDHMTPLVTLALHTGCRRGELFGLRWTDIDVPGKHLVVRGEEAKSSRTRIIPLNSEAVTVLSTWREIIDARPADLVFPGEDGQPLVDIKVAWSALLEAASITEFRFHDLRHTFASRLVMAGVDLNTVRELLGHADLKMTLRYAHLAPEHKAAAVQKLVGVA